MKLYQNALKLHSQGSGFFDAAQDAYDALFDSEIFKYPESLPESKRAEVFGDSFADEDDDEETLLPSSVSPVGGTETAPNTLPQILYLSYKNYGQFLLDRLTYQFISTRKKSRQDPSGRTDDSFDTAKLFVTARNSLDLFSQALERDDTDSDLWRRIARLGGLLGSQRLARFCLEAVLDTDDSEDSPDPMGLEELFAREELQDLIELIQDRLSEAQEAPSSPSLHTNKKLPKSVRRLMDSCCELPMTSLPVARSHAAGALIWER